jgi:hypothetical protein
VKQCIQGCQVIEEVSDNVRSVVRDEDILYILDDSNASAIRDFSGSGCAKNAVVKEFFEDDFKRLDSKKTLFRLEHKDPTLKCLALADSFRSLYPEESDSSFNYSKHEKTVMDVLDAVKSFPHLEQLLLAVSHDDLIVWREGNAGNALFSVMRDLPSKVIILIRVAISSFDPVAEMMKHCPNVNFLTISVDGWTPYGSGTVVLVRSLSDLPVSESVKLERWGLHRRESLLLYVHLMKKKSVKSIAMVGTQMSEYLASKMLQIYQDSDKCNQLQFLSFFGHHSLREQWEEQWQEDIDVQLAETAHIKHTRRSVSDFMNNINSRETSSYGRNEDLQFITDIVNANKKDSEDGYEYDWIPHPDHLYALIQSKPDYRNYL